MLVLVAATAAHAEEFLAWRSEPAMIRFNPLRPMSLEELREHLSACRSDLSDLREGTTYRWMIQSEGLVRGTVAIKEVNLMMGLAEVSYGVAEAMHGRGIATQAVGLLLDQVFQSPVLRRVVAYVHEHNAASCRVLAKLGFEREGLLREHYLIRGEPVNEWVYGLLAREWAQRRSARNTSPVPGGG